MHFNLVRPLIVSTVLLENKEYCEKKGLNLTEHMLKFVMASAEGASFRRNTVCKSFMSAWSRLTL